jgi:hypothetical protein
MAVNIPPKKKGEETSMFPVRFSFNWWQNLRRREDFHPEDIQDNRKNTQDD